MPSMCLPVDRTNLHVAYADDVLLVRVLRSTIGTSYFQISQTLVISAVMNVALTMVIDWDKGFIGVAADH